MFGSDLFENPMNWHVLVRGPVNQCEREKGRKRVSSLIDNNDFEKILPRKKESNGLNDNPSCDLEN